MGMQSNSRDWGRLYIISTPIGNLDDISVRATSLLRNLPVLACEDTRTTRRLLSALNIPAPRLISCYDAVEKKAAKKIRATIMAGTDVGLVSEAGTPGVSDPGYRIVRECVDAGITIIPVPGPCAAVVALSASGLPTDRFTFLGFPPKRRSKFIRFIRDAVSCQGTAIIYTSARELEKLMTALQQECADCQIVIARELTKVHEEFIRGTAQELVNRFSDFVLKGEFVVLVGKPQKKVAGSDLAEPAPKMRGEGKNQK